MSSTLTEQTLASMQAPSTGSFSANHFDGDLQAEHIYIGDDSAYNDRKPTTVCKRLQIKNLARGKALELTFFEEGFLRLREGTRKRLAKDHTVELRFVDPNPLFTRRIALPWLWASLLFGLAFVAAPLILPQGYATTFAAPMKAILATAAVLACLIFIYRSEERIRFVTLSGRASVLELVSSFGCLSNVRRATRAIQRKIVELQQEAGPPDERHLRAEMQAHYKLRETGVISHGACSEGTARILSRFG